MYREQFEQEYTQKRFGTRRDDRTSVEKLDADARLRGHIGTYKANQLIKAIDEYKGMR